MLCVLCHGVQYLKSCSSHVTYNNHFNKIQEKIISVHSVIPTVNLAVHHYNLDLQRMNIKVDEECKRAKCVQKICVILWSTPPPMLGVSVFDLLDNSVEE